MCRAFSTERSMTLVDGPLWLSRLSWYCLAAVVTGESTAFGLAGRRTKGIHSGGCGRDDLDFQPCTTVHHQYNTCLPQAVRMGPVSDEALFVSKLSRLSNSGFDLATTINACLEKASIHSDIDDDGYVLKSHESIAAQS